MLWAICRPLQQTFEVKENNLFWFIWVTLFFLILLFCYFYVIFILFFLIYLFFILLFLCFLFCYFYVFYFVILLFLCFFILFFAEIGLRCSKSLSIPLAALVRKMTNVVKSQYSEYFLFFSFLQLFYTKFRQLESFSYLSHWDRKWNEWILIRHYYKFQISSQFTENVIICNLNLLILLNACFVIMFRFKIKNCPTDKLTNKSNLKISFQTNKQKNITR